MKKYFGISENKKIALDTIKDKKELRKRAIVKENRENIVIIKYGDQNIGLKVDELYGEHQAVIKSLGEALENVVGISGGSILGSGEIALVLDVSNLVDSVLSKSKSP